MHRGPKNLEVSFTGKNFTHFGGVYLISLFIRRLHLKHLLGHHLRFAQRNNHYSTTESILALMYPSMLGIGRIETTHLLKHNGVFQYLVGIPAYPSLHYRSPAHDIETAEFFYQPVNWKKRYRFVVIRRPIPEEPTEQLSLFSIGKYSYQVIVTNMELKLINV